MSIITAGIDLAKNIFAVHGVNEAGKAKFRFWHEPAHCPALLHGKKRSFEFVAPVIFSDCQIADGHDGLFPTHRGTWNLVAFC